jgi:hypothetical protein
VSGGSVRRAPWPALVAIALIPLASGCLGHGEGPFLYLDYRIANLADEDLSAYLGPHCGSARLLEDRLEVERDAYRDLGQYRPFLVVEPDEG